MLGCKRDRMENTEMTILPLYKCYIFIWTILFISDQKHFIKKVEKSKDFGAGDKNNQQSIKSLI